MFSIIGPAMIGPSSSHTAGAVRLGRMARAVLEATPDRAEIVFYGSFADTYKGHGTDLATTAGLLGYETDDPRIPHAIEHAEAGGMSLTLSIGREAAVHPNTVEFRIGYGEREVRLRGISVGGGNIKVETVNGFDVAFSGAYPTLLVYHADREGIIAEMTTLLTDYDVNIGWMKLDRKSRREEALTVFESDSGYSPALLAQIRLIPEVRRITVIDRTE
ncbi:MAG TPA: L-serine ammonia-lyase, iron-sulfur-dependent subunit beta [Paenibacillus sp.]